MTAKIVTGSEAIALGALRAGVKVVTGYPGTPSTGALNRLLEMDLPDHRRIFVSGTASIAPEGHTIHVGNVKAQIAKTVEVIGAILESREMGWSDVTRGIAYVREPADIPLYSHYCARAGLPPMPVVTKRRGTTSRQSGLWNSSGLSPEFRTLGMTSWRSCGRRLLLTW